MKRILILSFLMVSSFLHAQTSEVSEAYKKSGLTIKTPLIKPKYPSYNLAAMYILTQKANEGDPFAQHELGIRYILGIGVPIDSVKAAYWIGEAASKNLPAANFNYGIMLNNGIGVEWNPFKAFQNFKIAAESGMEQALFILGLLYTDNLITNKNLSKAFELIKKSADKGLDEAKKIIREFEKFGFFYQSDSTTTQKTSSETDSKTSAVSFTEFELDYFNFNVDTLSKKEEREYLNEILKANYDKLKDILKIKSLENISENKDTSALGLISFAANAGSPEALLILGRLSEFGVGYKIDYVESASNYLKAYRLGSYKAAESLLKLSRNTNFFKLLESEVKKDNPVAMYVWAGLIALGMDYSLTEQQAFELLKKASEKNYINSIIELGLSYYSGTLVKKDSLLAIEYFQKGVNLGSPESEVRLAFLNISNKDSVISSSALQVLLNYSSKGSVLAEAALAYCYENGIVVKQNKAKAVTLYRLASQRGNEAAYNSLRKMYDSIRPDEEEFQIYF